MAGNLIVELYDSFKKLRSSFLLLGQRLLKLNLLVATAMEKHFLQLKILHGQKLGCVKTEKKGSTNTMNSYYDAKTRGKYDAKD